MKFFDSSVLVERRDTKLACILQKGLVVHLINVGAVAYEWGQVKDVKYCCISCAYEIGHIYHAHLARWYQYGVSPLRPQKLCIRILSAEFCVGHKVGGSNSTGNP